LAADRVDRRNLPGHRIGQAALVPPAMDLEGRIADLAALQGELGVRLRAGEAPVVIAVVGTGVTGDALLVTAQELVERSVVILARQVPQRDVDRREADPGDLPQ